MGQKPIVQKGKQNFSKQTTISPRLWPDFPKQVPVTIGKQPSLMKNIFFGGFTKSWKVSSKKCNPLRKTYLPQLLENVERYHSDSSHSYIFDISLRHKELWYFGREGPGGFVVSILGHTHGCTFTFTESGYHLHDPFTGSNWSIPEWDSKVPLKYAAMSKDIEERENRLMVAVTGTHCSDLVFCEFDYYNFRWSKQQSTIIDPYSCDEQLMQITSIMGYKGKFYVLTLQGALAVIEVIDSQIKFTRVGSNRAVPSIPCKHFREFMIESEGEILLIFMISRKSINVVNEIEIYRLEFERLSRIKMAGIGGKSLFVGKNCCIILSASKVGCKGNCVYFNHQRDDDDWWVFDMEKSSILPGWSSTTKSPIWDEPIADENIG